MSVLAGSPSRTRLTSLDGLRGVAALIVVVHHSLLTVPVLALPYFTPRGGRPLTAAWWLTYTPLHLVWNGTVAVYVFFVLSGLVLTLPVIRARERAEAAGRAGGRAFDWRSYYPRRLVRLYLPVWVSVVAAYGWWLAVPRHGSKHQSVWLNYHHRPLALPRLLDDLILYDAPGHLNGPLWSLKYEVLFSLLLPAYVAFALLWRRAWAGKLALLAVVAAVGMHAHQNSSAYLPLFAVGALMAVHREGLLALAARLGSGGGAGWWTAGLTALSLVATSATWLLRLELPDYRHHQGWFAVAYLVEVFGSALMVYLAWCWIPWRRVLDGPAFQWLGSRSFSLYLVHEPLVVSVALLLGHRRAALTLLIALPLVTAGTELFYRLVEKPSITLAKRTGERIGPWLPGGRGELRIGARHAGPGRAAEPQPARGAGVGVMRPGAADQDPEMPSTARTPSA